MEKKESHRNREETLIPWPLWLGMPCVTLAVLWLVPLLGRKTWEMLIPNEIGFLEIGTVVLLLPAIVICFYLFLRRRDLPKHLGTWMLLIGLAALYFAGEEISWGQTYFQWETPEAWSELNQQHETNLHNLDFPGANIFNNIPRQGMLLACIIGGIILPLAKLKDTSGRRFRGFLDWATPPWTIIPASLMAVLSTVPEKLYKLAGIEWPYDGYAYMAFIAKSGEFKEYGFALFILLYVVAVLMRYLQGKGIFFPPAGAIR